MSKQNFNSLIEFVDSAEKNRKYLHNTAYGLKAALKLFGAELNQEEKDSLEFFKKNFEQIFSSVDRKNKKDFTASSLLTYKSRVQKTMNDFKRYGLDASKMATWNPSVRKRGNPKSATKDQGNNSSVQTSSVFDKQEAQGLTNRFELAIREDATALIVVPANLTLAEANKIKKQIDAIVEEEE